MIPLALVNIVVTVVVFWRFREPYIGETLLSGAGIGASFCSRSS